MDEMLRLTTPQVATFAARGFLRLDAVVPDEINQAFLADVGDVPEDQVDHILAHYGRIMASSAVPLTVVAPSWRRAMTTARSAAPAGRRAAAWTCQPAAEYCRANSRPIPLLAPVIRTVGI